ncbi:MAG: carbonic anhydrase [Granulosicoccus sp.]|nr:carbonic anhydrase [Granulosicoccus sp.]
MITADDALSRLNTGNQRFVTGKTQNHLQSLDERKFPGEPVQAQQPLAIILSCSDARVPPEIIFDQQIGDLFIIRVAGNIVTPSILGSVEFSVVKHECKLIVVLGHTHCGAVEATVQALKQPSDSMSENLQSIISRIQPVVAEAQKINENSSESELINRAIRANIMASVAQLKEKSQILNDRHEHHDLQIIGAKYALETGCVEFFNTE